MPREHNRTSADFRRELNLVRIRRRREIQPTIECRIEMLAAHLHHWRPWHNANRFEIGHRSEPDLPGMNRERIGSVSSQRRLDRSGLAILTVILLGLASRRFPWLVPTFLHDYPGDAFWATAAYLGSILIWPGIRIRFAAAAALAISFGVEISQLYHAAWIDAIRDTLFGRLILGSGFDGIDLVAYALGVLLAMIMDRFLIMRSSLSGKRIGK